MKEFIEKHWYASLLAVIVVFGVLAVGGAWKAHQIIRRAMFTSLQANLLAIEESRRAFLSARDGEVSLLFVGDVMLSRAVGEEMEKRGDYRYPFSEVSDVIASADLAFANLESPISSRGRNQGSKYSFRADPKAVDGLAYAGFDVLSVANNHIWDWGQEALADTVELLRQNGIDAVGAGQSYSEANRIVTRSVGGTRVAYLAYTNLYPEALEARGPEPGISDFDAMASQVESAREAADIVVVSLHWGEEYQTSSNALQKTIGRSLIDAGADLVIGHHPHVLQEIEPYKNGWIAYSLGNFVFDQTFSRQTTESMILVAHVKNKNVIGVEALNVTISETFQPELGT